MSRPAQRAHPRPRPHNDCFLLHVTPQPTLGPRERRALRRRLAERVRQLGLLVVRQQSVFLVFGAERRCTPASRLRVVEWLGEQPESCRFAVFAHQRLTDLLRSGEPPPEALKALAALGDAERVRSIVFNIAAKMTQQWVRHSEGCIP